jgi:hypothetical protein
MPKQSKKTAHQNPSKDFQSFDEAASKLFRVPVQEVRELEKASKSDNGDSEE